MKICPNCGQEFPATPEYFVRNKSERSGLGTYCKHCHREKVKLGRLLRNELSYDVPLPEHLRECGVCKRILPANSEYFTTNKKGKNGLQSYCKECGKRAQRSYRKDNPERVRATEKKRQSNPNRMEYGRINSRERYKNDPLKQKKARRTAIKRRARIVNAQGSYSISDIDRQIRSQNNKCWWCGKKLEPTYEIDHLMPLSRGGTNWPNNLVITCQRCNRSKHNKMPWEWSDRLL